MTKECTTILTAPGVALVRCRQDGVDGGAGFTAGAAGRAPHVRRLLVSGAAPVPLLQLLLLSLSHGCARSRLQAAALGRGEMECVYILVRPPCVFALITPGWLQLRALSSSYTDGTLRRQEPVRASNGFLFKITKAVPVRVHRRWRACNERPSKS